MIVVTGTAPRCGTSAMMRLLLTEYKPHSYVEAFPSYVARDKNPEGFWDVKDAFGTDKIPYEEDAAIKLWAPHFPRVDADEVKLLVVMHRDNFKEQVDSIHSCAIAEGLADFCNAEVISSMFINQQTGIENTFNETPQLRVRMSTLREDPDSVISQIKEMI
jgi:hypothetical protein